MTSSRLARDPGQARGRLRIGDDWNAITIIALSQSNPLKAIAELVENSIDAKARAVTITRGRHGAEQYLSIRDDGGGVPRDADGRPDFRYVATHICDSVKRRLKESGATGIQGEFGIGLLSFWTIGESLAMTCAGADQRSYQMVIRKGRLEEARQAGIRGAREQAALRRGRRGSEARRQGRKALTLGARGSGWSCGAAHRTAPPPSSPGTR